MRRPAATTISDPPPAPWVHVGSRRVYAGDVSAHHRLRLDGVARLLQDVAGDDLEGHEDIGPGGVVRRCLVVNDEPARLREHLQLSTWCSGVGRRWAERRTSLRGDRGAHLETVTLWVHVDLATGRPQALSPGFLAAVAPEARQHEVSARLDHDLTVDPAAVRLPWTLRYADLDVLGHVNNALGGAMAEEAVAALATRGDGRPRRPVRAELEYRSAIDPDDAVEVLAAPVGDQVRVWVVRSGAGGPGDALPGDAVPITAVVTTA